MIKTVLGRLRLIALIEGVSYLVLLGIAMPLKYLANIPIAVKVTGWVHGALFVLFCFALLQAMRKFQWKLTYSTLIFLSSLVPFGTFFMDKSLREKETI